MIFTDSNPPQLAQTSATTWEIELFLCAEDNYAVLIKDPARNYVVAIDAPDGHAMIAALDRLGWGLDAILITHRHNDHIVGLPLLQSRFSPEVIAPLQAQKHLMPEIQSCITRYIEEGDKLVLAGFEVEIWALPGHCADHVAYYFRDQKSIFVGDTLFVMGCGRVFDGTPAALYHSLQRIASLPDETKIYCGHEYTLANARFCASIEPENQAITTRLEAIHILRAQGGFTLPTTLAEEKATNVFLRAHNLAEFTKRREARNRA